MPNYFAPYNSYYPVAMPQMQNGQQNYSYAAPTYGTPSNNYWISVDGEVAARAWQMPANLAPNTIIPLWDIDGQHVYFKSTDAYGRINPIRKGRVIFDDNVSALPNMQPNGESMAPEGNSSSVNYVTKEDFEGLRHELQDMVKTLNQKSINNQNGNKNRGDSTK